MIYLASPYWHSEVAVREARFQAACRQTVLMLRHGMPTFSPIAQSHPMAPYGLPGGWDFWEGYDREFLGFCSELWVLTIDGWRQSRGVNAEIGITREARKPIRYVSEGSILASPEEPAS
jgi:hypothetical protein